jgi:hypothetical protein
MELVTKISRFCYSLCTEVWPTFIRTELKVFYGLRKFYRLKDSQMGELMEWEYETTETLQDQMQDLGRLPQVRLLLLLTE